MLFLIRTLILIIVAVFCLTAYSAAAPVVLFDESHGQKFLVGNNGPLDLSALAALYKANGVTVKEAFGGLTAETLASVDVLVISGPFLPLSGSEIEVVMDFINAGGGLAIMLHIAPPVSTLLHRLDVDFTNGTLRESGQVIYADPLNFKVRIMADHPVTRGLVDFSVYGAWALRGMAPHTMILAETSPHSWVDLNYDGRLSKGDAVQTFGVMVAGEIGLGRFVALGDDALFQNRFLDEPNRLLALHIINWLGSR